MSNVDINISFAAHVQAFLMYLWVEFLVVEYVYV